MTLEEFTYNLLKRDKPRKSTIVSIKNLNIFQSLYRDKLIKVKPNIANKIFTDICQELQDILINDGMIKTPIGNICIIHSNRKVFVLNHKCGLKVDWNKTHKLWFENETARLKKILEFIDQYDDIYMVKLRDIKPIRNIAKYSFRPNSTLMRTKIKQKIKEGNINYYVQ